MTKKIKTLNTSEFLDTYMQPGPTLKQVVKKETGSFFIINVQDLIRLSKLPVPPTRSTAHTLIYLTSGVATMSIGFHPVKIHKGECLIVAAGQLFSYEKYEVNDGFIAVFEKDFLVGKIGSSDLLKEFEFLNIWGNPVIRPDKKTAAYLTNTLQRVFDEYSLNGLENSNIIQAHFLAALCDLNSVYKPLINGKSKTAVSLMNRFKEMLHDNIRVKHLVTDYAEMLNVSPNHLNKTVREVTQKSASKWIDETLMTEAKALLSQTAYPISDIAAGLGLYDQSYFSRVFKKYEGLTPQEFRKKIEKS